MDKTLTVYIVPTFPEAQALLKNGLYYKLIQKLPFTIYELEKESLLTICGMGQTQAKNCILSLLKQFSINKIVLLGVCGALNSDLKTGVRLEIQKCQNLKGALLTHGNSDSDKVSLCVNDVVLQPQHKELLSQNYPQAQIIEMESYPLAEICLSKGIPFNHIRWVFDEYKDELPDTSQFTDVFGRLKIISLIFSLLKNPSLCLKLRQLSKKATICFSQMDLKL